MSFVPRHMTSADAFPPKTPGKVRLYNTEYCPYASRARLMLTKKGVDYETINVNLVDRPGWFSEKYPGGTVPVLEIDDKVLGESLVIAEYVDEVYSKPGEQTMPTDPYEKGKVNVLIANEFSKAISAINKRLVRTEHWEEDFFTHVGKLNEILENRRYFAGDHVGYADYMIWPWLRYIGPDLIDDVLPTGRLPNVERWLSEILLDETIKQCYTRQKVLAKFTDSFNSGKLVFDGLENDDVNC